MFRHKLYLKKPTAGINYSDDIIVWVTMPTKGVCILVDYTVGITTDLLAHIPSDLMYFLETSNGSGAKVMQIKPIMLCLCERPSVLVTMKI